MQLCEIQFSQIFPTQMQGFPFYILICITSPFPRLCTPQTLKSESKNYLFTVCSQGFLNYLFTFGISSDPCPFLGFLLLLLFFVFCFCIIKNLQRFDTIPKWKIIFTDINSNVVLCLHQAQSSLLFPRPTNTSEKMHLHEMQCVIITFAYIKL